MTKQENEVMNYFNSPIEEKKVRKGVTAYKYLSGVIVINDMRYYMHSMTEAIKKFREDFPATPITSTNKEKVINALKDIIFWLEKSRNEPSSHIGTPFGTVNTCKLCRIYKPSLKTCRGCPFATRNGTMGCNYFAVDFLGISASKLKYKHIPHIRTIITKLQEYPKEQFTKKGWKYFNLLSELK